MGLLGAILGGGERVESKRDLEERATAANMLSDSGLHGTVGTSPTC